MLKGEVQLEWIERRVHTTFFLKGEQCSFDLNVVCSIEKGGGLIYYLVGLVGK